MMIWSAHYSLMAYAPMNSAASYGYRLFCTAAEFERLYDF